MPAELDNLDPEMDQSQDMDPNAEMDIEPDAMAPAPAGADDVIGTHGDADREGAMAKADLFKLANYSHKLYQKLQDDDQLEAWVQAKITKAADYMASVYHYLEYEMKFSEYGHHLDNSDTLSEGQRMRLKEMLSEAKNKVKDLKKTQAEKLKDKKVDEGVLSGGERACTECGGTGMVYEEPKAIPDHVKTKAQKYNTMMKATHAAHKRMDANKNGIPDEDEMDEGFGDVEEKEMKVGQSKKTRTGELTKTNTGVIHKNTSYKDDGDEIASNAKSGKGIKSHAKAQSAAEKKEKAPAQKKSKTGTWGMENGEKFDNRKEENVKEVYGQGVYEAKGKKPDFLDMDKDGNKKETMKKAVADKKKGAVKEAAKWRDPKHKDKLYTQEPRSDEDDYYGDDDYYNPKPDDYPGAKNLKGGSEYRHNDPLRTGYGRYGVGSLNTHGKRKGMPSRDHITSLKGSIKDAHGKHPHPNLPEAAKPSAGLSAAKKSAVVKDAKAGKDIGKKGKGFEKVAKAAGGGEKGKKIAAAAMWKNIKETQMYIAEKTKAVKDLPGKQEKLDVDKDGKLEKSDFAALRAGKKTKETVKESTDLNRLRELTGRLNQAERPALVENREVDQIRALTKRLLG